MPRRRYDWAKIKQEFFASDYVQIKQYFNDLYKIYNATIAIKTKGWAMEKEKYKMKQISKANKEYEAERARKWKKALRHVDTARIAWLQELGQRLIWQDKVSKLQVREITEALKHMRLELWETTDEVSNRIKVDNDNPLYNRLKDLWLD